jgi:hypothetical protein
MTNAIDRSVRNKARQTNFKAEIKQKFEAAFSSENVPISEIVCVDRRSILKIGPSLLVRDRLPF